MLSFLEINGLLQMALCKFCIFFIQKMCQNSVILLAFETGTVLRSYILTRWRKHFILDRNYKCSEGSFVIYPSHKH